MSKHSRGIETNTAMTTSMVEEAGNTSTVDDNRACSNGRCGKNE